MGDQWQVHTWTVNDMHAAKQVLDAGVVSQILKNKIK
jgi:hypothetical protein